MNTENVIEVKNVTKTFKLVKSQTLKGTLVDLLKLRSSKNTFNALHDVSFSVKKGEILGIIGVNGAGKSTLLSVLAETMYPTSGSVESVGVVSSLLELGAGFHSELTGRENIFLYGSIMGISHKTMEERFEKIVEFAGLEKFIDQPVKHYSSGMYVRLGFAVAVEVNPDILLIDEVLAVGDMNFQKKCLAKLNEFKERGKTMLIISHDITVIQRISDRVLILDAGKIVDLGEPDKMVGEYEDISRKKAGVISSKEWGSGEIRVVGTKVFDDNGQPVEMCDVGSSVTLEVEYEVEQSIDNPVFGFSLVNSGGMILFGSNTQIAGLETGVVAPGTYKCHLKFDTLPLADGEYYFSLAIHSYDHATNYHRIDRAASIYVKGPQKTEGDMFINTSWKI
ncbi:MAG: ABC transporter ATP-binding protein [Kiritimatiellae bacterium]|jgi:ABC-type polysaccharide/polyol phosphate transport system ATPase subunit|nr:ABC transporter ATP-binding protein [Kiritimatiellia bacterium]